MKKHTVDEEDYTAMVKKMQVVPNYLLMIVNWIAAIIGFQIVSLDRELVQVGCRQIPAGHCDFDPALAEHFKSLDMRNGMHISLAVSYAVIGNWNRSNKKRGRDERTYGSDRYYSKTYAGWVSRTTWGRHMDELAKLGLVLVSEMKNKPAYEAVPYQLINEKLILGEIHGEQEGVHGEPAYVHDEHGGVHDVPPIIESSEKNLSSIREFALPAAPTREDAAAGQSNSSTREKALDENPMPSVKVASVVKADDIQEIHPPAANPIPPVAVAPLSPVDWLGEEDCPEDPPADLKEFFNACRPGELEFMIQHYGADRIRSVIEAVKLLPNVDNPPGLVRTKLRLGALGVWKWPSVGVERKSYVGKYADFIEH